MIISKLQGGLGNQMFQYAAGFALAKRLKTSLYLDLSWYTTNHQGDTIRKFDLDCFTLSATKASNLHLLPFKLIDNKYIYYLLPPWKYPSFTLFSYTIFREQNFAFNKQLSQLKNNIYLIGFWNSELYFKDCEDDLRKEFQYKEKPSSQNQKYLDQINDSNSVSLHVRRGDYVKDAKTNAYHGTCSLHYYQQAISLIGDKINDPNLFIFSDDPEWVKENLKFPYPTYYVTNNQNCGWEDLRLMLQCKHHIIANSTFSWWGAWLATNKDKIVIAPQKWFNVKENDPVDLIPKTWIRM